MFWVFSFFFFVNCKNMQYYFLLLGKTLFIEVIDVYVVDVDVVDVFRAGVECDVKP